MDFVIGRRCVVMYFLVVMTIISLSFLCYGVRDRLTHLGVIRCLLVSGICHGFCIFGR